MDHCYIQCAVLVQSVHFSKFIVEKPGNGSTDVTRTTSDMGTDLHPFDNGGSGH